MSEFSDNLPRFFPYFCAAMNEDTETEIWTTIKS